MNYKVFQAGERVLHEMKPYVVGEASPRHIFLVGTESATSLTGPNPHARLMPYNNLHAELGHHCRAVYEEFARRERAKHEVIENGRVIFVSHVEAWRTACAINHREAAMDYLNQTLPELAQLRMEQRTVENCARVLTDRSVVLGECTAFKVAERRELAAISAGRN